SRAGRSSFSLPARDRAGSQAKGLGLPQSNHGRALATRMDAAAETSARSRKDRNRQDRLAHVPAQLLHYVAVTEGGREGATGIAAAHGYSHHHEPLHPGHSG